MNWGQDVPASAQPQPPTPGATPRSGRASAFDATAYETPPSGLATFESFFPFSASPLQNIADSYDLDAELNAASTAFINAGLLQPPTKASPGGHNPAVSLPNDAPLSAVLKPLDTFNHGSLTLEATFGNAPVLDAADMALKSASHDQSGGSMQTPPPTVSTSALSPETKAQKRRRCPDDHRSAETVGDILSAGEDAYRLLKREHSSENVRPPTLRSRSPSQPAASRGVLDSAPPRVARPSAASTHAWDVARVSGRTVYPAHLTSAAKPSHQDRPIAKPRTSRGLADPTALPTHTIRPGPARSSMSTRSVKSDHPQTVLPFSKALAQGQGTALSGNPANRLLDNDQLDGPLWEVLSDDSGDELYRRQRNRNYGQLSVHASRRQSSSLAGSYKERQTLKPCSSNGAIPSTAEPSDRRVSFKRRCTEEARSFSQSRAGLESFRRPSLAASFLETADFTVQRTRSRKNKDAMNHAPHALHRPRRTTVSFSIDGSGRAKAEMTAIEMQPSAGDRSALPWTAGDDGMSSDVGEDSFADFNYAVSRNTSFAAPDAQLGSFRAQMSRSCSTAYLSLRPTAEYSHGDARSSRRNPPDEYSGN